MASFVFRPEYDEHYNENERISFNVHFRLQNADDFNINRPRGLLYFSSSHIEVTKDADICQFIYSMFMKEFEYRVHRHYLNASLTNYLKVSLDERFEISIKEATPDDISVTLYTLFLLISQRDLPVIEYTDMDNVCSSLIPESAQPNEDASTPCNADGTRQSVDRGVEAGEPVATSENCKGARQNSKEDSGAMSVTSEVEGSLCWDPFLKEVHEECDLDYDMFEGYRDRDDAVHSSDMDTSGTNTPDSISVASGSTTTSINRNLNRLNLTEVRRCSPQTVLRKSLLNTCKAKFNEDLLDKLPMDKPAGNSENFCKQLATVIYEYANKSVDKRVQQIMEKEEPSEASKQRPSDAPVEETSLNEVVGSRSFDTGPLVFDDAAYLSSADTSTILPDTSEEMNNTIGNILQGFDNALHSIDDQIDIDDAMADTDGNVVVNSRQQNRKRGSAAATNEIERKRTQPEEPPNKRKVVAITSSVVPGSEVSGVADLLTNPINNVSQPLSDDNMPSSDYNTPPSTSTARTQLSRIRKAPTTVEERDTRKIPRTASPTENEREDIRRISRI